MTTVAAPDDTRSPWSAHRERATVLRGRYPFAAEILGLYAALLDVWEDGWAMARDDRAGPAELAGWASARVLPGVVKATEAAGPEPLAIATRALVNADQLEGSLAAWLAGVELPPVERFLARATLRAPLEALDADAGAACAADPSPRGGRRCPCCGGSPQLSFRDAADDPLLSGGRRLMCARCGQSWSYSAGTCASCGETSGSQRTMYAEPREGPVVGRAEAGPPTTDSSTFPQVRIEACTTCQRYLIDIDLSRDPRAVPEVDELAALPLDLYAVDHGLTKITPNLVGF